MTAESVFGDSRLIAEVGPASRGAGVTSTSAGNLLDGWTGHLRCVDEDLMLRVWRRLLADDRAVSDLRNDVFLKELLSAINEPLRVPTDTNASLLARALVECSDTNRLLPFADSSGLRDNELMRAMGHVSYFRGVADGWTLRLSVDGGQALIVRFSKQAFLQNRPRGLHGAKVLVLALVHDARKCELTGIALLVRKSP